MQPVIDEFELEIGTDQGDAVGHVFRIFFCSTERLRTASRREDFGLGARLFGQLLGLREGFLALLQLRDIAIDPSTLPSSSGLKLNSIILAARGAALVARAARA